MLLTANELTKAKKHPSGFVTDYVQDFTLCCNEMKDALILIQSKHSSIDLANIQWDDCIKATVRAIMSIWNLALPTLSNLKLGSKNWVELSRRIDNERILEFIIVSTQWMSLFASDKVDAGIFLEVIYRQCIIQEALSRFEESLETAERALVYFVFQFLTTRIIFKKLI